MNKETAEYGEKHLETNLRLGQMYDWIVPLEPGGMTRIVIAGDMARVENLKTGEVGAWSRFDLGEQVVRGVFRFIEGREVIVHFSDGSFLRGRFSGDSITWHPEREVPPWQEEGFSGF